MGAASQQEKTKNSHIISQCSSNPTGFAPLRKCISTDEFASHTRSRPPGFHQSWLERRPQTRLKLIERALNSRKSVEHRFPSLGAGNGKEWNWHDPGLPVPIWRKGHVLVRSLVVSTTLHVILPLSLGAWCLIMAGLSRSA